MNSWFTSAHGYLPRTKVYCPLVDGSARLRFLLRNCWLRASCQKSLECPWPRFATWRMSRLMSLSNPMATLQGKPGCWGEMPPKHEQCPRRRLVAFYSWMLKVILASNQWTLWTTKPLKSRLQATVWGTRLCDLDKLDGIDCLVPPSLFRQQGMAQMSSGTGGRFVVPLGSATGR